MTGNGPITGVEGAAAATRSAAPPVVTRAQIVAAPEALLARLDRALMLSGTAVGTRSDGAVRIRTQVGEIAIRTPTPVEAGRVVTLQIPATAGGAAPTPRIPLPVVMLAPPPAAGAPRPPAPPASGAAPAVPPAAPVIPTTGIAPRPPGIPMPPPASGPVPPGTAQPPAGPLPAAPPAAGSPAPVQVPSPAAAIPATPTATPAAPAQAAPAFPAAPAQAAAGPSPLPSTPAAPATAPPAPAETTAAPPAAAFTVTSSTITPPTAAPRPGAAPAPLHAAASPAAGGPAAPAGPVVQAQAPSPAARTDGGPAAPILLRPLPAMPAAAGPTLSGAFNPSTVAGQSAPAAGRAVAQALGGLPPSIAAAVHRTVPVLPDAWPDSRALPAFREALATLMALDPAVARQVAETAIPRPDGALAGTLLLFVSVLRGGDARGWLGDRATRLLSAHGKDDLLARVNAELAGDQRGGPPDARGAAAEWRLQPIPMLHGGEITPVQLWLHRPDEDEASERRAEGGGTRFVLDIEFSRLGALQLDGLVRDRRFDLVLRSQKRLPAALRRELPGVFVAACESVAFTGALRVQTDAEGWVTLARRRAAAELVT